MSQFLYSLTLPLDFPVLIKNSLKESLYQPEKFLEIMKEKGYPLEVKKPSWFNKMFYPNKSEYEIGLIFIKFLRKYCITVNYDGPQGGSEASLVCGLLFKSNYDYFWVADNIPYKISKNASNIRLYTNKEIKSMLTFFESGSLIKLFNEINELSLYEDYGTTKETMDEYKYEITEFIMNTAKEAYDKGLAYGLGISI